MNYGISPEPTGIIYEGFDILVAMKNLTQWEGASPPANGRIVESDYRWNSFFDLDAPATDYDRFLEVNDIVDILAVGDEQGIVFSEKQAPTCFPDD